MSLLEYLWIWVYFLKLVIIQMDQNINYISKVPQLRCWAYSGPIKVTIERVTRAQTYCTNTDRVVCVTCNWSTVKLVLALLAGLGMVLESSLSVTSSSSFGSSVRKTWLLACYNNHLKCWNVGSVLYKIRTFCSPLCIGSLSLHDIE